MVLVEQIDRLLADWIKMADSIPNEMLNQPEIKQFLNQTFDSLLKWIMAWEMTDEEIKQLNKVFDRYAKTIRYMKQLDDL